LPVFFGLGAAALRLLGLRPSGQLGLFAGVALALGLLVHGLLVLATGSLAWGWSLSLAAAFAGWLRLGWPRLNVSGARWAGLLIAALALFYGVKILAEPIQDWDARSIWFFHAKLIYFDKGFHDAGLWSAPAHAFSHPNYPVLFPILAAQAARIAGFWNETLPKLALFWLLSPALLLLGALSGRGRLFWVPAFLFFLAPGIWLWNGYMDAYLAVFVGLGLLYLSLWWVEGQPMQGAAALVCLGLALNLKDEARLAGAALGLWVLAMLLFGSSPKTRPGKSLTLLALLSLSTALIWEGRKRAWGLQGDLHPFSASFAAQASQRLKLWRWILGILLREGHLVALWGFSALLCLSQRRHAPRLWPFWLAASAAQASFILGMLYIYLGTPYEISWHLANSAGRVMLTPFVMLPVALLAAEAALVKPGGQA
jgi:hypothetical protein